MRFTKGLRYFSTLSTSFALIGALAVTSACSRKSGCPVNEPASIKTDKNGNFKSSKGASNLFPKDMRRKGRKG